MLPQLLRERRPDRERPLPASDFGVSGRPRTIVSRTRRSAPPGSARSTSRQRSPRISPRRRRAPTTMRKMIRACSRQRRSSPSASSISSPKAQSTRPASTGLRTSPLAPGLPRALDRQEWVRADEPLPKRRAAAAGEEVQLPVDRPGRESVAPSGGDVLLDLAHVEHVEGAGARRRASPDAEPSCPARSTLGLPRPRR